MFTIEEARISRPSATRRIPRGVTFEYSQENVLRALEERDRAAGQERARFTVAFQTQRQAVPKVVV